MRKKYQRRKRTANNYPIKNVYLHFIELNRKVLKSQKNFTVPQNLIKNNQFNVTVDSIALYAMVL